jgi:hypothetical protein
MTTGEALVLAWICDALNDHVGDQFYAEVVRDAESVVREPVFVLRIGVAGTLRVRVEELPAVEEPEDEP